MGTSRGLTRGSTLASLVLVALLASTWTLLSPAAAVAQEESETAPDPALPQAILAFLDTEGMYLSPSAVLTPGATLRVRVGLINVPAVNTEATAYLVRAKLLVERDILSRTETFGEGRRPIYSNGRQTPQFVDLSVPTVDDGSQPAVAVVVMYDADGPGSAAGPIQLVGSYLIRIQRTAVAVAERYAPTLKFTDGEIYFPVEVEAMLENAELKHRRSRDLILDVTAIVSDRVIAESPVTPMQLLAPPLQQDDVSLNDTYLELDIPSGDHDSWWQGVDDQGGAAAKYERVVYARVVPVVHEEHGRLTVVQYWMFYAYNPKGPGHEGDWEAMQIVLEGRDLSVLRGSFSPLWIDYAAHGNVTRWASCSANVKGQPHAYVARDSHASYRTSGRHPVDTPVVPDRLNLDVALGDGVEWSFARGDYMIRLLEAQVWLDWPGRWGDWGQIDDFAGPRGPKFKTSEWDWSNPLAAGQLTHVRCE